MSGSPPARLSDSAAKVICGCASPDRSSGCRPRWTACCPPCREQGEAVNRALLQRLVPNTLAAATEGRQRADIGPFALFVSEASDDPIQSFAVPVAPAPDWRPALVELQQAFDAAGRRFRIEFFRELHPALSPTLYAMGYEREMEAPLMILHRDAYRPAPNGPARLLTA